MQDFETRFAAAKAINSLYGNRHFGNAVVGDECALPSLFALYDSLNDDDDEIRDLSAQTASALLKKSLLPLAASRELAAYLKQKYPNSTLFAENVVCRMTGNPITYAFKYELEGLPLQTAAVHFSKALKNDDSLFVEEEQNLFVDEVREVKVWSELVCEKSSYILEGWVREGLKSLNELLEKEDGPLGWMSKAATFAVCMRILVTAKAILRVGSAAGEDDIKEALEVFRELGRKKKCHESLLFEAGDLQE